MRPQPTQSETGFTLIELLAVVAIISILTAITIPLYLGHEASVVGKTLEADIRSTQMKLNLYLMEDPYGEHLHANVVPAETGQNHLTLAGDAFSYTITATNPDANPACLHYESTTDTITECDPTAS